MNCKPEDWEKGKKIFLTSISIIIVIMIVLVVVLLIVDKKVPENGTPNIIPNGDVEFSGPEYKPSKVYNNNQEEIALSNFSDKAMVLIFFNTTNQESLEALEIFSKYEETYLDKINIIGICISDGITEDSNKVKTILEENNISLKNILFDLDYSAKEQYDINIIPTLVCIDKKQEIINTISRVEDINEDVITANLDILAENY